MGDLDLARCAFCGESIIGEVREHEIAPDVWVTICQPCERATEVDAGK